MIRFITSPVLALAGLVLFGQGAYIHAKALLAQVLLERAFSETIASGREVKPWSWADTWPVARIEVKRLHASTIVLAGSSGQAIWIDWDKGTLVGGSDPRKDGCALGY